jgi:predicted ATPase/DNA-binding SARP family transcriptional activator
MPQLVLYLFGTPRLERDGTRLEIHRRKVMALLIYLAVTGKSHLRDSLATMFWPDHDQGSARAALRRTLSELQKTLGEKLIRVEQDSLRLERTTDLWSDIDEFRSRLEAYRIHGHHPEDPCPDCLLAMTEALSLYQGDFLTGFTLRGNAEFDEWQILQTEILRRESIDALRWLVMGRTANGELSLAIDFARRWLVLDPIDEAAHRFLMQLYAWNGQRSEALHQYQECVCILKQELGVQPLDETAALYEHIRSQKNLPTPVLSSPPQKSISKPDTPNNLPVQLTSFIGRLADLEGVKEELSRPYVHLLTLTGPAGVGKTRLCLEVAAQLLDQYEDGVFFVNLAPIFDPALVGQTIAHVLGVRESGSKPLVESLKENLREKHLLLVLDNFEHLTKAAPLVTELLTAAPGVKVLVTSRTLLHIYGERLHPILPLPLPKSNRGAQLESVTQSDAVQLFAERARAVRSTFELAKENIQTIVEICTRLDGLPLAIELAAARVGRISPQAMLGEWKDVSGKSSLQILTDGPRDLPDRHKTMRNAIAWSYNLLDANEQAAFRQAGVFVGGWTLDAAEKVIGESLFVSDYPKLTSSSGSPFARMLDSFVDTNLIKQSEVGTEIRFFMLETIREYALERLVECGEVDAVRCRHTDFFLALAEAARPHLFGSQQVFWVNRLEQEYDNLRAALIWAVDSRKVEIALRLGSALGKFWYIYGPNYWSEGRKWLEQALNLIQFDPLPLDVRANALNEAGVLAWVQIDYEHAILRFEECLALRKRLGDKTGIGSALGNLGLVAREQLNLVRARAYQEKCLALKRELGDRQGIATALSNLALVAADQGDIEYSISLYEESLIMNRELQNKTGLTLALHNLGGLLVENRGDIKRSLILLEESLELSQELGERFFLIPLTLHHLGNLSLNQGDYEHVRSFFEQSLNLSRETDNKYGIGLALLDLGRLAHLEDEYVTAQEFYKQSIAVLYGIKGMVGTIWNLVSLADLACINRQPIRAATLLGASEKFCEITSSHLPQVRHEEYEHAISKARTQIDEAQFIQAWAKGREMSLDQAVEYALDE